MITASCVFLILFALVGAVDGLYFHLWKYKLYARAASVREHLTHTLRAVLFLPMIYLLYGQNVGGTLLWLAVLVIALDLAVETRDVILERAGREDFGGLSTAA